MPRRCSRILTAARQAAGIGKNRRSWQTREALELATLEWVDWFNHRRLLESFGNRSPAEAEAIYYQRLAESAEAA